MVENERLTIGWSELLVVRSLRQIFGKELVQKRGFHDDLHVFGIHSLSQFVDRSSSLHNRRSDHFVDHLFEKAVRDETILLSVVGVKD